MSHLYFPLRCRHFKFKPVKQRENCAHCRVHWLQSAWDSGKFHRCDNLVPTNYLFSEKWKFMIFNSFLWTNALASVEVKGLRLNMSQTLIKCPVKVTDGLQNKTSLRVLWPNASSVPYVNTDESAYHFLWCLSGWSLCFLEILSVCQRQDISAEVEAEALVKRLNKHIVIVQL